MTGGGSFMAAADDVELTVSTAGCAAAPIFRAAQYVGRERDKRANASMHAYLHRCSCTAPA